MPTEDDDLAGTARHKEKRVRELRPITFDRPGRALEGVKDFRPRPPSDEESPTRPPVMVLPEETMVFEDNEVTETPTPTHPSTLPAKE